MRKPALRIIIAFILFTPISFLTGCHINPSRIDGKINPIFQGRSFTNYAVAAVNIVPRFRKELEHVTAIRIQRSLIDRTPVQEFRILFPHNEFEEKRQSYTLEHIKQTLHDKGVEVFIFINVIDTQGSNLEHIDKLDRALLAGANNVHDPRGAYYYGGSDVLLFELSTGKIIWKGHGVLKAKPHTPRWFNASSTGHAAYLVSNLKKAGLIEVKKWRWTPETGQEEL